MVTSHRSQVIYDVTEAEKVTIVHELQKKALTDNIAISDLLRNAYAVAVKLNLIDFEQWLKNELNGYSNENELPEYRFIKGIMRSYNPVYGWIDVTVSNNRLIHALENLPIIDKISKVENLAKSEQDLYRQLPPEMARSFAQNNFGMQAVIFFSKQQFHGIVGSVRTKVLDWALFLEQKEIVGEEMTFNEKERAIAPNIMINNFVSSVTKAPIQQGTGNTMSIEHCENDFDNMKFLVSEIKKLIDAMPQGAEKETLQADIASVECQLKSPNPKMEIIKELFSSARNILEGTFGSLIASHPAIADAFKKLFV